MPMRWVYILLICLFLPSAVSAAGPSRYSLDRILPHIRNHMPGTLYDVEGPYFDRNGAVRYRLKWMTPEGDILWILVDGRNGDILRILPNVRQRPDDRNRDMRDQGPPPQGAYHDDGWQNDGPPHGGPGPRG